MREIDEVRITLLRMFRGAVRLPEEIIDEMLKAFLHTQDAAIKVQAYGRGLLARFRDHNLLFGAPFNTQARVLHDNYMASGATPYTSDDRFQGETRLLYEANEANSYWRSNGGGDPYNGSNHPTAYIQRWIATTLPQFTLNEWPGIKAIWGGRASRRSRRALGVDRVNQYQDREPLARFGRWLRRTEKRMAWYHAHHRLRWRWESSPASARYILWRAAVDAHHNPRPFGQGY